MSWSPGKHSASAFGGDLTLEVDVAVIGAGAGGGAAAAVLAEQGLRVAVLEEGRHWSPNEFSPDTATAFRELYQARGTRALRGNAVIPMPGGRGVGGSTLINSAICFKTPPAVLDSWRAEHGCEHIDASRFEAYFDRIWRTLGVVVNPMAVQRNNNLIFRDGVEALGLNGAFLARSAPGCVGCGICQYGCPTGGKFSVDRTFLAEAARSGQAGIYADCRMRGVVSDGGRIQSVTGDILDPATQQPKARVTVKADRFLLSGGPVGSPMFLLGNGLADNNTCGRNLVIHPTVGCLARFPHEIKPWSGVTQGYYVDCWDQGFLLQTYTVTPDQYFLVLQTRAGPATEDVMADLAHMASAGALVHDEDSEGRVRYTPAGPDLSYHLGDGDRGRLIDGLKLAARVYFAAGATEVFPGVVGVPRIGSEAEIESLLHPDLRARDLMLYASHPMGTCRMGDDPSRSVVDPNGCVWGWDNLYVADASVFPTSLGVNPQVTTMAMGMMVAEQMYA